MLQFEEYLNSEIFLEDQAKLSEEETHSSLLEVRDILYHRANNEQFTDAWERSKVSSNKLKESFLKFLLSCESNQNYQYWNYFQHELHPILRDFELAVRKGDWDLFVSAVGRSLNVFFGGSRPNYSRYGSIFYEDMLDLQRKFPMLLKHYKAGGFVCYMSENSTSGIGMDQGLEKHYNYTAKAIGGIIGITRQKQSVALWDIVKHNKDLFSSFLKDSVSTGNDSAFGELSLHHEFSAKTALECSTRVALLIEYIKSVKSPFRNDCTDKLINIVTKEEVDNPSFYINFHSFGNNLREKFVQERFTDRSVSLYAPISFKFVPTDPNMGKKKRSKPLPSDESENSKAVKFIQYAQSRGKTIDYVLQFPICSRPVFLLEKDKLFLKKAKKSDLMNALLANLMNCDIIVGEDGTCPTVKSDATVIDFMAVVRRLTSVDTSSTFGSLCQYLLNMMLSYGSESKEVHVILENYKELSPKGAERLRRAGEHVGRICEVLADEQQLPDWGDFYSRTENKTSFQNFFVDYCIRKYTSAKPLYLAGGIESDPDKCTVIMSGESSEGKEYRASHEEADDRMMLSIQKIYLNTLKKGTVTVYSPDTDIFVVLLYHIRNTWQGLNLYLLKSGSRKITKKSQKELYHLNLINDRVEGYVIDQLPAAHSLTGCDTVAKVGTKLSLLKTLETDEDLLTYFGKEGLDHDMITDAEQFLVKVVNKKYDSCLTFNELRVKLYHQSKDKKFVELPCSSAAIQENIKRAYMQTRCWLDAPFLNAADWLDPCDYGYTACPEMNTIEPCLFSGFQRPQAVPEPCITCKTCAKRTCPCRVANVACNDFCGCSEHVCKNPCL